MGNDDPAETAKSLLNTDGLPIEKWGELPSLLGGNEAEWKLNACVGSQYDDELAAENYRQGYRQSAELIYWRIHDKRDWMDTLVYPFVFSWRHFLELSLKRIIVIGNALANSDSKPPFGHKLLPLWKQAMPHVVSAWKDSELKESERITNLVTVFDGIDPTGETFRYELNNKQVRHLEDQSLLNMADFHLVACSLADFLEGIALGLEAMLDGKH